MMLLPLIGRLAPRPYHRLAFLCVRHATVEATPNPSARKITPTTQDDVILDVVDPQLQSTFQYARFHRSLNTQGSDVQTNVVPLVDEIFELSHDIREVFLSNSFLSVALKQGKEWDDESELEINLCDTVDRFFEDGPADESTVHAWLASSRNVVDSDDNQYSEDELELINEIQVLLEEKARPNLQADGGDVLFRGFKDGVVTLSMIGACASCPSSTVTMHFMIKNLLLHYFPDDIVDVVQAEDDSSSYFDDDWTG